MVDLGISQLVDSRVVQLPRNPWYRFLQHVREIAILNAAFLENVGLVFPNSEIDTPEN